MAITAREEKRKLIIDLGDDETYLVIPPVKGEQGRKATALLVGVTFGASDGLKGAEEQTDEITRICLGESLPGFEERLETFSDLRGTEQMLIGQAVIFWNCQGGSIEAVNDILDSEPGVGLPKALNRVMRSYGLDGQYKRLTTFLGGESQEPS